MSNNSQKTLLILTEEEFIILKGFKLGLNYAKTSKCLNKPLRTCDSRIV